MAAGLKLKDKTRTVLACIFTCIGGIGLWLFLRSGIPNYLFFRVPFAFLDYEKAGVLVFFENLLRLSFWGFTGTQAALICRNATKKYEKKKNPLIPVAALMAAAIIGVALMLLFPPADGQGSFGTADWSAQQSDAVQTPAPDTVQNPASDGKQEPSQEEHNAAKQNNSPVEGSVS